MPASVSELIDGEELARLEAQYGAFEQRHYRVRCGETTVEKWLDRQLHKRRGEILLVMQRPNGRVLLHRKRNYPKGIFRLPTGGINWQESVVAALKREVFEETSLPLRRERLVGVLTYELVSRRRMAPFVSYVFQVPDVKGKPVAGDLSEGIDEFRWIWEHELAETAAILRSLPEDKPGRKDWGRFRAPAHDFIAELQATGE